MHEYSLVQAMMRRVEEEARARNATAVHRVHVRIGRFSGVEANLFATAYEVLRPGTLCANAELAIAPEAGEWHCGACGTLLPAGAELVCQECGWPASLMRGGDLVLERIELEVG
ncbi:MAG TPA: hydrogenase maturation nickel metallochaperone HypA [Candidatus Margulisiibacteriota bacterium]|nr:hydrogenase maturation nickel metallochaperone HypA [Candidatus Margulisiibacteriota bacterium]